MWWKNTLKNGYPTSNGFYLVNYGAKIGGRNYEVVKVSNKTMYGRGMAIDLVKSKDDFDWIDLSELKSAPHEGDVFYDFCKIDDSMKVSFARLVKEQGNESEFEFLSSSFKLMNGNVYARFTENVISKYKGRFNVNGDGTISIPIYGQKKITMFPFANHEENGWVGVPQ